MHLVDRFLTTIRNLKDRVAVVHENQRTTYGELGQLAANLSADLVRNGLEKGDRAAMLVANSPGYVAVFYGIWAAGGVTVALNTQAKSRDIVNWMNHSGARHLFVDESHPELSLIEQSLGPEVRIVRVHNGIKEKSGDGSWDEILSRKDEFPECELLDSDIASIIYTSGTTGQPKGVTLSHGNLAANVDSILAYLELTQDDSIVNVLPFYYSYGNSILHTHMAIGAKLVLENSLLYPHKVIELVGEQGVTGFSGVPSTFSLLLGRVKLENYDLSCLRYLTQAGGPMPPSITDKLTRAIPQARLFIMYGQTEATARLSYLPSDKVEKKRGSIGVAIPGVTLAIRDKKGKDVAPGEVGEICAHGPNIMLGYWRDEERTSRTIKDGWLHTGDLAHYDSDGYIYIDGRSSDMIKTGGNRISPKEVEEVIQEIDGVQEVAVVGISDEILGETIKAFVVPMQNAEIDRLKIQRYCRDNLASYKIPKSIEFIDTLPRTSSGKVQRFVLQKTVN